MLVFIVVFLFVILSDLVQTALFTQLSLTSPFDFGKMLDQLYVVAHDLVFFRTFQQV